MMVSRENVESYSWGNGCQAWPLLDSGGLSVKEESMAGGNSEETHCHHHAQQFFYILQGDAVMKIGKESHHLKRGEGIRIPPGKKHRIVNETGLELRFLVISQPTTTGDRIAVKENNINAL